MKTATLINLLSLVLIFASCKKDNASSSNTSNSTNNQPVVVHVSAITVAPTEILLFPKDTKQLTTTITPSNADNKKITWSSSNANIATVDNNGLVTAIAIGHATITATSADMPNISASAILDVIKTYDVYLAGSQMYQGQAARPILWKNGIATELPSGTINPEGDASSVFVSSNNDVYVAGSTVNSNFWHVATYWKNNVPTYISNPANGYTNGASYITGSGNTIYIATNAWDYGTCPNCQIVRTGMYYKIINGYSTQVPMFSNGINTQISAIAVSGNDVYVGGMRQMKATIWKNNYADSTPLTLVTNYASITAMAANGSDIYAVGNDKCDGYPPPPTCKYIAKLWKNNMPMAITNGSMDASAEALAFYGNDVYVAGGEYDAAGLFRAKLWKVSGSTVTPLQLSNSEYRSGAYGIFIAGSDIFVAGFEVDKYGDQKAKYWRLIVGSNAIMEVPLPSLPLNIAGAAARSIFVK